MFDCWWLQVLEKRRSSSRSTKLGLLQQRLDKGKNETLDFSYHNVCLEKDSSSLFCLSLECLRLLGRSAVSAPLTNSVWQIGDSAGDRFHWWEESFLLCELCFEKIGLFFWFWLYDLVSRWVSLGLVLFWVFLSFSVGRTLWVLHSASLDALLLCAQSGPAPVLTGCLRPLPKFKKIPFFAFFPLRFCFFLVFSAQIHQSLVQNLHLNWFH